MELQNFVNHLGRLSGSLAELTDSEFSVIQLHRGGKTIMVVGGKSENLPTAELGKKLKAMAKELEFVAEKAIEGTHCEDGHIYHFSKDKHWPEDKPKSRDDTSSLGV